MAVPQPLVLLVLLARKCGSCDHIRLSLCMQRQCCDACRSITVPCLSSLAACSLIGACGLLLRIQWCSTVCRGFSFAQI